MEAHLEQLDDQRVRLTVPVPAGEVRHAVSHAAHDLAERVKVPGFRAGKVPPEVLLSRIGKQRLYSEAVESHISTWFWSAARDSRLRPTQSPAFSYELPASDEQDWEFTAEFAVQGPAEPADWHVLEVPRLEVEVDQELVGAGLEALQGTVASLSSVEGRPARDGDVAVVDIISDGGFGQRDYVAEIGSGRLLEEIEAGMRDLAPGESHEVAWELSDGATRSATVTLKQLYEKVLPPLDDDFARSASEFETLPALRASIEERIRGLIEEQVDDRFRADAVDELVKATKVEPAPLVVEVRTRELLNALLRQLDARGIDPVAYLRMAGVSGEELELTLRAQATQSIARELVLEGTADKLSIEVSDEDIRGELREGGESDAEIDAFLASGLADRVRHDLRLRRAAERIAAEVKPISKELADVRERLWTPDKETAGTSEKKLWTPGSTEEGALR